MLANSAYPESSAPLVGASETILLQATFVLAPALLHLGLHHAVLTEAGGHGYVLAGLVCLPLVLLRTLASARPLWWVGQPETQKKVLDALAVLGSLVLLWVLCVMPPRPRHRTAAREPPTYSCTSATRLQRRLKGRSPLWLVAGRCG